LRERGFVCSAKLTTPIVTDRLIGGEEFSISDAELVHPKDAIIFAKGRHKELPNQA